ncbi:5'-deoxynucleotidase [Motiliproteus coralliicola]|uniref:5'-deoxynucleotidase n=1 Tax=Motiliproteus coralliicola TaxID=2283196 RepID=A0A369WPK9_9GAMM|nr:5'-deoxynucleotidase [Motiliproteus coralliicola]RDE22554.1 5'-deoxynucleotidase [Motiliproteus coralliicola]
MTSHFFAYIDKLRWVIRWGLKRNTVPENVKEHSWDVATIAHALAVIRNRVFGGNVDVNAVVVAAIYHDSVEAVCSDVITPVKYHSRQIREAFKEIERTAEKELVAMLPEELKEDFSRYLVEDNLPQEHQQLIKMADSITAYLKCQMELKNGNMQFSKAAESIGERLKSYEQPEIDYFLRVFAPSYDLTLDEILAPGVETAPVLKEVN